jgi:hypothetical protein
VTFFRWLAEQKDRADRVGDLARDALQDRADGARVGTGVRALRRRMFNLGACDDAVESFEIALREWPGFKLWQTSEVRRMALAFQDDPDVVLDFDTADYELIFHIILDLTEANEDEEEA